MKLSRPTQPIWMIAVIVGVIGILGHFVPIPAVAPYAFELVTTGFVLLVLGTFFKGI